MPLPDLVRKTAEKILDDFCESKIPPCLRADIVLQFEIEDDCITLVTETGPRNPEGPGILQPVARFCYSPQLGQWTLHYPDRNGGWRFYLNATPSLDLNKLLFHVSHDPLGAFWI